MTEFDSIRTEIQQMRQTADALERRVNKVEGIMQGDPNWRQKGFIDQLAEVATFMAEMKGLNIAEVKAFAADWNDFKKRVLWLAGGIMTLLGFGTVVLTNLDKIQNLFRH